MTVVTSLRIEEYGSDHDKDDSLCYGDSCERDRQVPARCYFLLNVYPFRYCCLLLVHPSTIVMHHPRLHHALCTSMASMLIITVIELRLRGLPKPSPIPSCAVFKIFSWTC